MNQPIQGASVTIDRHLSEQKICYNIKNHASSYKGSNQIGIEIEELAFHPVITYSMLSKLLINRGRKTMRRNVVANFSKTKTDIYD